MSLPLSERDAIVRGLQPLEKRVRSGISRKVSSTSAAQRVKVGCSGGVGIHAARSFLDELVKYRCLQKEKANQ